MCSINWQSLHCYSGTILSNATENIDFIVTYEVGTVIAGLNFTSLHTSQAGIYLCFATVTSVTPGRIFNLNESFVLQIKSTYELFSFRLHENYVHVHSNCLPLVVFTLT